MKNLLLKTVLLFIFLTGLKSALFAQHVNTDALEAYWRLIEPLKKGDTLSRDKWEAFLKLPGNKQYVANQNFSPWFLETYRKALQTAYMPQNAGKLKKMMEHPFDNWIVYKANQYKINEAALKAYSAGLKKPAYLDSMYKQAWAWLPKRLQTKSPSTNIFFIGIDNDAIVQGDTIVFTTWSAYNDDILKYGILGGHELHHVLRKGIDFGEVKPAHEALLYLLCNVLNEGTADMVDKKTELNNLDKIPAEFHYDDMLLNHPDSIIKQIDTAMRVLSDTKDAKSMTVKQARKLINYSSGHDPGYYMADIIVRNGFKNELLEHIQNPFYFIYLYNKAAKKDKQRPPVISDKAITYCKALEKMYWK
ncbi:MAG: hypothetical protein JWQ57_4247 [Mucilaginibacter sp.]|nr:hypothetical protein [Mucilaginibacter sp.]